MAGRRRALETMEKDAKAADLYRRGLSYRQIAGQLGYRSTSSAHAAVRRAVQDSCASPLAIAETRALLLDRLQDYRRVAWRVATTTHYATTAAGVAFITSEDGVDRPLVDDGPVLSALASLLKFDDMEAKLVGAYAPAQQRITVITEDVIDAQMRKLEAEIAEREAIAAAARTAGETAPAS